MGWGVILMGLVSFARRKELCGWIHCGDGEATTWMYLLLLDCTLKSGYAGNIFVVSP